MSTNNIHVNPLFMGVDIGPRKDPSAFSLLQRVPLPPVQDPATYETTIDYSFHLRQLKRILPGATYPQIASEIREYLDKTWYPDLRLPLVMDATAIGKPVLEFFRESFRRPGLIFVPVTIAGVWKRDLLQTLDLLFQQRRLIVRSNLIQGPAFLQELESLSGRDTSPGAEEGTWRDQPNDDLVFAVALAAWHARRSISTQLQPTRPLPIY